MNVPYRCSCLIDQDRYIGGDPVGYSCSNPASWELDGYLFCNRCRELIATQPERVRISPTNTKASQERVLADLVRRLNAAQE